MMTRLVLSLLTSAALFAPLAARVGAYPSAKPVQIALGESAAEVHQALGSPDVLSQWGGPPNSPTEKYTDPLNLEVTYLRGKVSAVTLRRILPSLRPASARKATHSVVIVTWEG